MRAYKTELAPNNVQRTLLLKSAGTARFAYNWGLARRQEQFKQTGKSSNAIALHRELNRIKKTDYPWMYEVSKCAPQEALRDLEDAFQRFFKGRARYPKYKSKKNGVGSFTLTGAVKICVDRVRLPRIGTIRLKEDNYLPTDQHILSTTVSEHAGRWFISVLVDTESEIMENIGPVVGVDLGVNRLATCSDKTMYANPRALKRNERKLRKLQRSLSRKKKGSNNRFKAGLRVGRIHVRIENIRRDAIHKITTVLAKTKSVIVIEDLNVSGMMGNHRLSKSIADASFGEFRRQLQYKANWYGSRLVVADRWFPSSKMCSVCGHVKEITLSERVYTCEVCGAELDRDLNAARNLEFAASSAETLNACGEVTSVEEEISVMQATSMNQESNAVRSVLDG